MYHFMYRFNRLIDRSRSATAVVLAASMVGFTPAIAQVVTGELTDSSKTAAFKGALVSIEELNVTTSSDQRGRFRLKNVPVGSYILTINYVGAATQNIPIVVGEDGLNLNDVILGDSSPEGQQVEEILVVGQSASLAGAINQMRAADNIKSVLDSDAMGQFPDQNVAEALRRLAGVSVENDQGEGRYVVIRGLDPDLNATSINGVRASAAENRRALQLDVIPSDVLDGLEVQKSLTPDMDGDAIGGSINVKTLSAFSRKGALMKGRIEGGYNELSEEWSPKGAIAGSNIFTLDNGKRLGVAAALSWGNRKLSADNNEADDWAEADNGEAYFEEYELRYYDIERERIGAVLNLDYDWSDTTTIYARSLYSKFTDTESRDTLTYKDLTPLSASSVSGGVAEHGFSEIESGTKDRDQTAENLSLSFGTESQWDRWGLKTSLGYNYAHEETPDQAESAWVVEFESGSGGIAAGASVLSVDLSDVQRPLIQSSNFDLLRAPASFELDEVEGSAKEVNDTQLAFKFDVTREYDSGLLQFGAKARVREKENAEDAKIFGADDDFALSDTLDATRTLGYGFDNELNPVADLQGVRNILADGTGLEFEAVDSLISSAADDWRVNEDIFAIYGLYKYQTDNLTLTAGVRVERTDFSSSGNSVELFEEGATLDGVVLTDGTAVVTGITASRSYTDVLPGINVRYNVTDNVIVRAAASRSVVRPLFEAVASRVSVEDNEAEVGNPDLEPFLAWNYDLSLEYYPSQLSILSAGLFYKEIDDFVFEQSFDDFTFMGTTYDEVTIFENGEQATVLGLELNYQQHLGFLPSPFDGFLISTNYTYVDGEAEVAGRNINLPKQSQNLGGFTLGYDKYGVDVRLALKYRGNYLDEVVEEGFDRTTESHTQLDFTVKYHLSENLTVYAEFSNLNDEPEYYYAGNENRLLQYDEFGTTSVIGLQFVY